MKGWADAVRAALVRRPAGRAERPIRSVRLEPLEPRILLSADVGIVPDPDLTPAVPGTEPPPVELEIHDEVLVREPQQVAPGEAAALAAGVASDGGPAPEATPAVGPPGEEPMAVPAPAAAEVLRAQVWSAEQAARIGAEEAASQIVVLDARVPEASSLLEALERSTRELGAAPQESAASGPAAGAAQEPATDESLPRPAAVEAERTQADPADPVRGTVEQLEQRGVEVIVLDAERDGLDQIGEILRAYQGVATLHVVSHGSAGSLRLGSGAVTLETLRRKAGSLTDWRDSLDEGADLLLYGCNVAEGDVGIEFVSALSAATGADVAASVDLTGAAAGGGDWHLEYAAGEVRSETIRASGFGATLADTEVPGVLAELQRSIEALGSEADSDLRAPLPLLVRDVELADSGLGPAEQDEIADTGADRVTAALSLLELFELEIEASSAGDPAIGIDLQELTARLLARVDADLAADPISGGEFLDLTGDLVTPTDAGVTVEIGGRIGRDTTDTTRLFTDGDGITVTVKQELAVDLGTGADELGLSLGDLEASVEARVRLDFEWQEGAAGSLAVSAVDVSADAAVAAEELASEPVKLGFLELQLDSGASGSPLSLKAVVEGRASSNSLDALGLGGVEPGDALVGEDLASLDLSEALSFSLAIGGVQHRVEVASGTLPDVLQAALVEAGLGDIVVADVLSDASGDRLELGLRSFARLGFDGSEAYDAGSDALTASADLVSPDQPVDFLYVDADGKLEVVQVAAGDPATFVERLDAALGSAVSASVEGGRLVLTSERAIEVPPLVLAAGDVLEESPSADSRLDVEVPVEIGVGLGPALSALDIRAIDTDVFDERRDSGAARAQDRLRVGTVELGSSNSSEELGFDGSEVWTPSPTPGQPGTLTASGAVDFSDPAGRFRLFLEIGDADPTKIEVSGATDLATLVTKLDDALPDTVAAADGGGVLELRSTSVLAVRAVQLSDFLGFRELNAADFVSLLGQLRTGLDQLADSDVFAELGIPFLESGIDGLARLGELLGDFLLFDDGGDGIDDATRLVVDLNRKLADATVTIAGEEMDADELLRFQSDGSGELELVGLGELTGIAVTTEGFGFTTADETSERSAEIRTERSLPSAGRLAEDASFEISLGGGDVIPVTIAASDTSDFATPSELIAELNATIARALEDAGETETSVLARMDDFTLVLRAVGTAEVLRVEAKDGAGALGFVTRVREAELDAVTLMASDATDATAADSIGLELTTGVGSDARTGTFTLALAAADVSDNVAVGNDVRKLVDEQNAATFGTAQELADRLGAILGLPDAIRLDLDPDGDSETRDARLRFTLDRFGAFDPLELPIDFDLDLGELLGLESDSTLRLEGDGRLQLEIGAHVGEVVPGAPGNLGADTKLSDLRDGRGIESLGAPGVVGESDVIDARGRVGGDAEFELRIGAESASNDATELTLTGETTDTNTSLADLVADLNALLGGSTAVESIRASSDGQRLVFVDTEPGATPSEITVVATNDLAKTGLGLSTSEATGRAWSRSLGSADGSPGPIGFEVEVGGERLDFTIETGETEAVALVEELNAALAELQDGSGAALSRRLLFTTDGAEIFLTAMSELALLEVDGRGLVDDGEALRSVVAASKAPRIVGRVVDENGATAEAGFAIGIEGREALSFTLPTALTPAQDAAGEVESDQSTAPNRTIRDLVSDVNGVLRQDAEGDERRFDVATGGGRLDGVAVHEVFEARSMGQKLIVASKVSRVVRATDAVDLARLAASDQILRLEVDGEQEQVTLAQSGTGEPGSRTLESVVADLNDQLRSGLGTKVRAVATRADDAGERRIVLLADRAVTSFAVIDSTGADGLGFTEDASTSQAAVPRFTLRAADDLSEAALGFGAGGVASATADFEISLREGGDPLQVSIGGVQDLKDLVTRVHEATGGKVILSVDGAGQLDEDAVFTLSLGEGGSAVAAAVTVTKNATADNEGVGDLLEDLRRSIADSDLPDDAVTVATDGLTLSLTSTAGLKLSITSTGGEALGFAEGAEADDGSLEGSALALGGKALTLKDTTRGDGAFAVRSVNGSNAAAQLGILLADTTNPGQRPDGRIEGASLGGAQLIDRFFITGVDPGEGAGVEGRARVFTPFSRQGGVPGVDPTTPSTLSLDFTLEQRIGPTTTTLQVSGVEVTTPALDADADDAEVLDALVDALNEALEEAELSNRIEARALEGTRLELVAIDADVNAFTVSGATALGFRAGDAADQADPGASASAMLGFVEVGLAGQGDLEATVGVSLKEDLSLRRLKEGLKSPTSLFETPRIGGTGNLTFAVEADLGDLGVSLESPEVSIDLVRLGNPFEVALLGDAVESFEVAGARFRIDVLRAPDDGGNLSRTVEIPGDAATPTDIDGVAALVQSALDGEPDLAGQLEVRTFQSEAGPRLLVVAEDDSGIAEFAIEGESFNAGAERLGLDGTGNRLPTIEVESDIGDLLDFQDLDFSAVLDGLILAADFLSEFEAFGFLDEKIPIIDVSVTDVLGFADQLDTAVQEVRDNPASSLQKLESSLNESLGIDVVELDFLKEIGRIDTDAVFEIAFTQPGQSGGPPIERTATVRLSAEATRQNTMIDELVEQLDAALAAATATGGATVGDFVDAERFGDALELRGLQNLLKLRVTPIDPLVDELGFDPELRSARREGDAGLALTSRALPGSNGQLSADLRFQLALEGGASEGDYEIRVARDAGNGDLDALVADVSTALDDAGLAGIVSAVRSGDRVSLRVDAADVDSIALRARLSGAGQLGFLAEAEAEKQVSGQQQIAPVVRSTGDVAEKVLLGASLNFQAEFDESESIDLSIPGLDALAEQGPLQDLFEVLGGSFDLAGSATVGISGSVDVALNLGIDLDSPTDVFLFREYTDDDGETHVTGIEGSLEAFAEDVTMRAALGPVGLYVTGDEENPSEVRIGAPGAMPVSVGLADDLFSDEPMPRVRISDLFDGERGLRDVVELEIPLGVQAALPIYFPSDSTLLGTLDLEIPDVVDFFRFLNDPDTSFETTSVDGGFLVSGSLSTGEPVFSLVLPDPTSFLDLFGQRSLLDDILLAVDGVDLFLEGLQDVLDGEVLGIPLPLIGDGLADGARFIEDFREGFVASFREEVESFADPTSNIVSELLFDLLASEEQGADPNGPALGLLLDGNGDGQVTIEDVAFTGNVDEVGIPRSESFVQWNLKLGTPPLAVSSDIGFDIGLPGLGLETDGDVNLLLGWELDLGFGISGSDGFYLDISDSSELEVFADVDIAGLELTGSLAFLQLRAVDENVDEDDETTGLGLTFGIDVFNQREEDDERLGLTELGGFGIRAGIAAEADVELGLTLEIDPDIIPGASGVFPTVLADFNLEWGIGERVARGEDGGELVDLRELSGNLIMDGLEIVAIQDITLDLGSFIGDFVQPVLAEIQKITQPLQPVIDLLNEPLPVISDLGPPMSLLDMAASFGVAQVELIDSLAKFISLVDSIPTDTPGELMLGFGSLTIFERGAPGMEGMDLTDPNQRVTPDDVRAEVDMRQEDPGNDPRKKKTQGVVDKLKANGDFALPILTDPSQVFGLLLGNPATLITYDLRPLVFDFDFSAAYPLAGPLVVGVDVSFGAEIDVAFGFDTFGIQKFFDSDFTNPLTILEGFFVSDTEDPLGTGADVDELILRGGLFATAALDVLLARAGVSGGVEAEIFFDLFDPDGDGRVRALEIIGNISNEFLFGSPALAPLALFDVSGTLTARLFAFFEIDFGLFEIREEFDITPPITLLDFELPFTRPPQLASEIAASEDVLQLNLGEFAADRLNGDVEDGGEIFEVRDDGGRIAVTAFGFTRTYARPDKIIARGGAGDDVLDMRGLASAIDVEIDLGDGDDVLLLPDLTGDAVVHGGRGNDIIVTGSGDDRVFGEEGDDILVAGAGADEVFGDLGELSTRTDTEVPAGQDPIETVVGIRALARAADGDDVVLGGAGNDRLAGSGGADRILGDGSVETGDARGVVLERLRALRSDPLAELEAIADGGAGGRDVIVADGGLIAFGDAADRLDNADDRVEDSDRGAAGNDVVLGGSGRDLVHGGRGADTLLGGDGADRLFGEEGEDLVRGGAGDDAIRGGSEDDEIHGGAGHDVVRAGDGNDLVFGDGEDDELFGDRGIDELHGGTGADFLRGGSDRDLLIGGQGRDDLDGQAGDDVLYGDRGTLDLVSDLNAGLVLAGIDEWVAFEADGQGRLALVARAGAGVASITLQRDRPGTGGGSDVGLRELGFDDGSSDDDRVVAARLAAGNGRLVEDARFFVVVALDGEVDPQVGELELLASRDPDDPSDIARLTTGDNRGVGLPDVARVDADDNDRLSSSQGNDVLDGGQGSDDYFVAFRGADTASRFPAFDSGRTQDNDVLNVDGTDFDDQFLLRSSPGGLSFVAMLNAEQVERLDFGGMEQLVVNGLSGNDRFASDDTRTVTTLNGDGGADVFQIGQLFKSLRNEAAGLDTADVLETLGVTRGFLSNGISETMVINAGVGNDEVTVFRNLGVLQINGEDGDDVISVRSFALPGSQESTRDRTDITGGDGADSIEYAVNLPVNIDGGDGLDSVRVIGTEFGDLLVITDEGVFGAGLNVSLVNVELLSVDGAEGDDQFVVKSTQDGLITQLLGGLGSDTFFAGSEGVTAVDSNDLRGHSGLVTHGIESNARGYLDGDGVGIEAPGVSANIGDADEPGVVISESGGFTRVQEGGHLDFYTVRLTHPPDQKVEVQALAPRATKGEAALGARSVGVFSDSATATNQTDGSAVTLVFDDTNWDQPQTVYVHARSELAVDADDLAEGADLATVAQLATVFEGDFDDVAREGERFAVIAHKVTSADEIGGTIESIDSVLAENPLDDTTTLVLTGVSKVPSDSIDDHLRGRRLKVVSGSEGAGQSLLVASSRVLGGGRVELTLFGSFDPDARPVAGGQISISQYGGTQAQIVAVQIEEGRADAEAPPPAGSEQDEAQVILRESGDSTRVIEREAADERAGAIAAVDSYDVLLSRPPAGAGEILTVALGVTNPFDGADQLSLSLSAGEPGGSGLSIRFVADPAAFPGEDVVAWNEPVTVFVHATPDVDLESFHRGFIEHTVSSSTGQDVDRFAARQQSFVLLTSEAAPDAEPRTSLLLADRPAVERPITVTIRKGPATAPFDLEDGRFRIEANTLVFLDEDGLPEEVEAAEVTVAYETAIEGFDGLEVPRLSVEIVDDDTANVLILESDGSTDLVEGAAPGEGRSDSYDVVLTRRPEAFEAGEAAEVSVVVSPEDTVTGRGRIGERSAQVRLEVPAGGSGELLPDGRVRLTFTADDWNVPQTIRVVALADDVIDGDEKQVFAPTPQTVAGIQGPLLVDGTRGSGSLEGLGAPVVLPGESNEKRQTGEIAAIDATSITVRAADLQADIDAGRVRVDSIEDLVEATIELEIDTADPPRFEFRLITAVERRDGGLVRLELEPAWSFTSAELAQAETFVLSQESLTFFADEQVQMDLLLVDDGDSPARSSGRLSTLDEALFPGMEELILGTRPAGEPTAPLPSLQSWEREQIWRLTGLGMGPDTPIGGAVRPGGITYVGLEGLVVELGRGVDDFAIDDVHARTDGFRTFTVVRGGDGDDTIDVNLTDLEGDPFVEVDGQRGNDRITADDSTLPLLLAGGAGGDAILGGQGADLIYGDFGTPLFAPIDGERPTLAETRGATGEGADERDPSADPVPPALQREVRSERVPFVSGRAAFGDGHRDDDIDAQAGDDRVFGGEGADVLRGGVGNDVLFGDYGRVDDRVARTRSIETSELFRGGADAIDTGPGNDFAFGGFGDDEILGSLATDVLIGEYARVTIIDRQVQGIVRLGQGSLDTAASTLFALYDPQLEPTGPLAALLARTARELEAPGVEVRPESLREEEAVRATAGLGGEERETRPAPTRYEVVRGNSLWDIAAQRLGDPYRWSEIYELNEDQIDDPDLIHPGMDLRLPDDARSLADLPLPEELEPDDPRARIAEIERRRRSDESPWPFSFGGHDPAEVAAPSSSRPQAPSGPQAPSEQPAPEPQPERSPLEPGDRGARGDDAAGPLMSALWAGLTGWQVRRSGADRWLEFDEARGRFAARAGARHRSARSEHPLQ